MSLLSGDPTLSPPIEMNGEYVRPTQSRRLGSLEKKWQTWAAIVVVFGLLQIMSYILPSYLAPDVPSIIRSTGEALTKNWRDLLATSERFVFVLATSMVTGWALGLMMAVWGSVGRLLKPYFAIMLAVPALSYILLAVLWVRNVELRIFLVVFVISLPFYVVNTYEGLRSIDKELVEAVAQFRPTTWQRVRYLLMPFSNAFVIMTTKTVSGFTVRILVFAELIGASSGVGSAMNFAQSNFRIDLVLAWTVVLVVVNFAVLRLVSLWEHIVLRWRVDALGS